MRRLGRFVLAAFDPLGVRSPWGWWRMFGVAGALVGTSGAGLVGVVLETRLGIPRGALAVPLAAAVIVALFCVAGARQLAKLDAYERPRLEIVFIPGEMPFEYVARTDVGTQFQQETERVYRIGIHNTSGLTVEDVSARLTSMVGTPIVGPPVMDKEPADLYESSGASVPFNVNPGDTRMVEVVRRTTKADHIRLCFAFGVLKPQFIPEGSYELSVVVYGRNVPPLAGPKRFRVSGDGYGRLVFEPIEIADPVQRGQWWVHPARRR